MTPVISLLVVLSGSWRVPLFQRFLESFRLAKLGGNGRPDSNAPARVPRSEAALDFTPLRWGQIEVWVSAQPSYIQELGRVNRSLLITDAAINNRDKN